MEGRQEWTQERKYTRGFHEAGLVSKVKHPDHQTHPMYTKSSQAQTCTPMYMCLRLVSTFTLPHGWEACGGGRKVSFPDAVGNPTFTSPSPAWPHFPFKYLLIFIFIFFA